MKDQIVTHKQRVRKAFTQNSLMHECCSKDKFESNYLFTDFLCKLDV